MVNTEKRTVADRVDRHPLVQLTNRRYRDGRDGDLRGANIIP